MKAAIDALFEAIFGAFARPAPKRVPVRAEAPKNKRAPWKG